MKMSDDQLLKALRSYNVNPHELYPEKEYINPTGLAAANRIEELLAACSLVRERMSTQRNGGIGWMSVFEDLFNGETTQQ